MKQLEAVRVNLLCVMTDIGFPIYLINILVCEIVAPLLGIAEFGGAIWQLASTPLFEECLAAAMVRTYQSPRSPDLSPEVIDAFDKSSTYRFYVELIEDILQGKDVSGKSFSSGWPNRLAAAASGYASAAA